jgi:ABC-type branched-subunit amino acid transport system ATPase component/branched-subunit amino acid ABC-type transport system permease component
MILSFIVVGITTGAIYGLASTGLVLTYRTSGVFNFAEGSIAAAAAYVFYWLNIDDHQSWWLSFIISVLILGPVAGLLLEQIGRRLARQRIEMQIVGTVGLILVVEGLTTIKFGHDALFMPQFLPYGSHTVKIFGVNVSYAQITIIVLSLIAVAVLYWLLRFSTAGVAMRAVVDDSQLVGLHGQSANRIRRYAWIIGTTFAALSGVLISPSLGIQATAMTYLVVQAFGAAAIGAFANIPLTYAGAVVIGIASAISTKYVLNVSWLAGLPSALPFILLFIALLAIPKRKLVRSARDIQRRALDWKAPPVVRLGVAFPILAVLALIPLLAGTQLSFFSIALTEGMLLLSLGLLVRTSGMVSLCHATFAAIGAVAFSQFSTQLHLPWLIAALLGALVVVPVAALLAIPAIRLSGIFLALATFGFGLAVESLLYARNFMFTTLNSGRAMPRPSIGSGDRAYFYVVLIFLILSALLIEVIGRARIGRLLRGLSESSVSVTTMGLNANVTRVVVFCISGFIAGLAGILYGCAVHVASSSDANYSTFYSLVLLAILAIAPWREPWYALLGIIGAVIPAYWTNPNAPSWLNVLFGLSAIQVAMAGGTVSLPAWARAAMERIQPRHDGRRTVQPTSAMRAATAGEAVAPPVPRASTGAGLRVDRLKVRYGGHLALDGVSLTAKTGTITALIGPNGAGKTTLFNACSGLLRPTEGIILLHDEDITKTSMSTRGQRGMGRTFQVMQLGDSLSVLENVVLGREAGQAGSNVVRQVVALVGERKLAYEAAWRALESCGIADLAQQQTGALSTGERRLVELARCLAGTFDVLLLDEPASGLSQRETERFSHTLVDVVKQRGIGALLVEHDVSLVMTVSSYVYVLNFGELIFEGTPAEVRASPLVKAAYLGSETAGGPPTAPSIAGSEALPT